MEHGKKLGKIALNLLVYAAVIAVIVCSPRLIRFFLPVALGWVISMLANPLAKFMEKRMKIVRKYTSAFIIVASIALVVLLCYLVGLLAVNLVGGVIKEVPALYSEFEEQMSSITAGSHHIFSMLPDAVEKTVLDSLDSVWASAVEWAKGLASSGLALLGNAASNIPNLLVVVIFTILSAYFFIADKNRMAAWIHKVFPESTIDRYHYIVGQLKFAVGGYFKAQFKIMLIIFAILVAGFLILRISPGFAIVIALLTAFLDFLPFLGTGFVLGPWAVIAFFTEEYYLVAGMGILYVVCLVVHQLVQPKLIGDSIGLDPFRTLIFMWIGYRIAGVLGMIVGIPVGMILVNLYENGVFEGVQRTFKELAAEVKLLCRWN